MWNTVCHRADSWAVAASLISAHPAGAVAPSRNEWWNASRAWRASRTTSAAGLPSSGASASTAASARGAHRDLRLLADGRYELVDVLGTGTVSTVYLARNRATNERVAARVLNRLGDKPQQDNLRARFLRQAALTAELNHPNIV
ncbi:MAG: hypothetical protein AB7J25_24630, partial [Pseudonocardia sp.]